MRFCAHFSVSFLASSKALKFLNIPAELVGVVVEGRLGDKTGILFSPKRGLKGGAKNVARIAKPTVETQVIET